MTADPDGDQFAITNGRRVRVGRPEWVKNTLKNQVVDGFDRTATVTGKQHQVRIGRAAWLNGRKVPTNVPRLDESGLARIDESGQARRGE